MAEYLKGFSEISEKLTEVSMGIAEELLVIILLSSLPNEFENFVIAIETGRAEDEMNRKRCCYKLTDFRSQIKSKCKK